MNKWIINISNLTNEEVDFYNFVLSNIDLLLYSTLNDVARDYGCGISFIYKFFEKAEVDGLKEFIYKIAFQAGIEAKQETEFSEQEESLKRQNNLNNLRLERMGFKMLATYNINSQLNFDILRTKLGTIHWLCEWILKKKIVYGFGLGHAELAIQELFGMFKKMDIETFQHRKEDNLDEFIEQLEENSIIIVYSFRGMHEYTKKFVSKLFNSDKKLISLLATANPKSEICKNFKHVIQIQNNVRNLDYLKKTLFISPLYSFIFLNDLIKNVYYFYNEKQITSLDEFKEEIESWRDL